MPDLSAVRDIDPRSDHAVTLRQCKSKTKHLSLEAAQDEAKRLHKLIKATFNAYHCPWCTYYHVGTNRSVNQAVSRTTRRGQ